MGHRVKHFVKILLVQALLVLPVASNAGDRQSLGWSSLFNNDALGDGDDRWRSSSFVVSHVRGPEWTGSLPSGFGELLEFRGTTSIISPHNLTTPSATDRPYAGTLSFDVYTHFEKQGFDLSAGVGLAATGAQTGHGEFQSTIHDWFGITAPSDAVLDAQIGNRFYPNVMLSASRPMQYSDNVTLRPFVEARAGLETLVRVGGDVVIGNWGLNDLLLRDDTTGHYYTGTRGATSGISLVVGGDVAWVSDSHYLPSSRGYELTDTRNRLRIGVNWEGEQAGVFYGLTWMGKEFEAQDDEQVVGTINLRLRF